MVQAYFYSLFSRPCMVKKWCFRASDKGYFIPKYAFEHNGIDTLKPFSVKGFIVFITVLK